MSINTSREDLTAHRNSINPVRDETHLFSKQGVSDDYTASDTKTRLNQIKAKRELKDELASFELEGYLL